MSNHKLLSQAMLDAVGRVGNMTVDSINHCFNLLSGPAIIKYTDSFYKSELRTLRHNNRARAAWRNLQRNHYIKTRKIGQKILISLTNEGQLEFLSNKLKQAKPHPQKFCTVVIFDIPESQRAVRDQVRYLLKQSDFKKLQQSVWVSRLDNYEIMKRLIKQYKAQTWINVFRATDFNSWPSN